MASETYHVYSEAALARAQAAPAALALESARAVAAGVAAAAAAVLVRLVTTAIEAGEILSGRRRRGDAVSGTPAAAVPRTGAAATVSTGATATAAITAISTATGTGRPPRPLLGLVHVEATATHVALIEEADRFRRLLLRRERREREPARSARHSIGRDVHIDNLARFRENLRQLLLRRGVAQVPDKNLGRNGESPSCALLTLPTRA
jgi:hypothetical protein